MMQTESTRMAAEDRRELERNIKNLQKELDDGAEKQQRLYGCVTTTPERLRRTKELRRLRRLRA